FIEKSNKAMAKAKTQYVCSECGSTQMKWMGKCPDCGEWNTLQEFVVRAPEKSQSGGFISGATTMRPIALPDIPKESMVRIALRMEEMNRVLGGGIVPGGCVLVGGEPGIGKSTILLQVAAEVARAVGTVLYVSAEESAHQVGRRA